MSRARDIADGIFNSAITVNESGADADFRVESDGNANMLFVDAGQNNFGVGHGSPNRTMHISSPGAEMSLANTNMSTDRKTMNWFMSGDKAHWRMLNDAGTVGGGNVILDWDGNLTVSGNLDFNNDYAQAEASTTTNRTVVNTSGWLDHLSVTFTPRVSGTVFCHAHFAHGYEIGPVNLVARFKIGASTYSNTFQIFKQGFGSNMAFGAHSMMDHFANVAASSQTVVLQVNNDGGSSTGIMNYFDSVGGGPAYGDYLQVFYR